ncbi:cell wall-active antibiotics response protein LiaF [Loigolactobacillus jiayinensis]|uniref:Cell wall-active antibiotics response protein LiaF n=1 Tax=Loigolactobacillus jiayinensis TaxID=2486016 RepID=A0ABW1RCM6_9LACO|nr:cell wall-active antibiotics response protein LiaF [Loigolactobacillus jiayinensis]
MRRLGPWRIFLIIEAMLLITLGWQLFSHAPSLVFLVLGALSLHVANKSKQRRFLTSFFWLFGILAITITLLTNPTIWLMLIVGIFFALTQGYNWRGQQQYLRWLPWNKKAFHAVKTREPNTHAGESVRTSWFGNQTIGNDVFEWQDINLVLAVGDTIVDLGNTLLPKAENTIVIRKGIGRTRILVPVGTAVMLDHTALVGNVTFNNKQYKMNNTALKLYSEDYDDNQRRIKLLTNVFIGDLEVIFV